MIITTLENGDLVWIALDRSKTGAAARTELFRMHAPDDGTQPEAVFPQGITPVAFAQYIKDGTGQPTAIAVRGEFYKVVGTTVPGVFGSLFEISDNKAKFIGIRTSFFHVTAVASFSVQSGREIAFRVAVNGVSIPTSEVVTSGDGVNNSSPVTCQSVIQLAPNDYVEIWCANNTNTNDVDVTHLNTVIHRVN